jgi:hypothetical protein
MQNGIRSSGQLGAGNAATYNVVHGNGSGNLGTEDAGISFIDNDTYDPQFNDRAALDYTLEADSLALGEAGAYGNGQVG